MLMLVADVDSTGNPAVRLIGTYQNWVMLVIQPQGPNTVRLSSDRQSLVSPGPGGLAQGVQVNAAMSGGITQIWWRGPLYAIGSAPQTIFELQELPSSPPAAPTN